MEDYDKEEYLKAKWAYKALAYPPAAMLDGSYDEHVACVIPKSELEDGAKYFGHCRNSKTATWDAYKNKFYYERTKWVSSFIEYLPHPENDDGFDFFVPVRKIV